MSSTSAFFIIVCEKMLSPEHKWRVSSMSAVRVVDKQQIPNTKMYTCIYTITCT